ncbi:interleukin-1 receptor accessory -like 1-A isoform X3 [Labeo rohita]|uniref:ribonuclease H n=1 Tax=Labeo rohita TaxID=84645 RepID=A0A498M4F2_LABRO|nr:interleukin-1 receptor accessory -like 1-A isoform X3 [Labeo rohita]
MHSVKGRYIKQRIETDDDAPVPKPEIQIDRRGKNPDVVRLICEYNETVIWKNSTGKILKGSNHNPKGEFITVENKRNPDNFYTCTLKNAVSEETSDRVYERKLFKNEDEMKAVGDTVSFRPTNINPPVTSIMWKHRSSSGVVVKVIEWDDDGFNTPSPRFKNITTLDEKTGQITITNLAVEHSGVYTIDINSKEQEQRFNLKVKGRVLARNRIRMKQIYRVPFERNSERVKQLRYDYVQRVMELEADVMGHEQVFVDEAGFNLTKTRRRGRNIIGHRAIINVPGQRGGQNEKEVFGALGGEVSFGPGNLNPGVTSIIWKQRSSSGVVVKAIEWDDDGLNIPNPGFRGITKLDRQTGQITISNLNADHSGVYTIDINSKEQEQRFRLELLPPVPKPVIKIDRTDKYPNVVYLICEYSEQIIWKNSAGENLVIAENHPKGKFITVKQNGNPESYYTCTLKNAVSEATSDPVYKRDLFEEPQEDPFDYWLRLNSTADITAECLKQQGKVLDNQLIEVTRMFIRNCPNSDLALTFRSKTIDKWTAYEVQEILNEYHSEKNLRATGKGNRPSDCEKKFSVNEIPVEKDLIPKALIDSGSMACTISESAEESLLKSNPDMTSQSAQDVVIVGCGGHRVTPTAVYDLKATVYGCSMIIPALVVLGQTEEMILGTNVIKRLLTQLRETNGYWKLMSKSGNNENDECSLFLSLFSNTERRRVESIPEKVGTVKLQRSVTLEPQTEHLVWGKLPQSSVLSVGSTVIVEPTESRSRPRQILVGRVITPLWGDGSIPLKVINPTDHKVVLKRNAKIADVSPCIAVQDLPLPKQIQSNLQCTEEPLPMRSSDEMKRVLSDLDLDDLDLESCEVSAHLKNKLLHIIEKYESVFSRDKMDCGEAKGFVHRINLTDDRPFRFPYRRIPPSQYAKLRTVLNEMEEKGIIRKSHSDYASPLILVWKKNGNLRICTDFRWLNARTVRDACPLRHQSDVLAALGGNAFFSTMDLTSGYYNVPLEEEHKKYTAFSSPFGLHEYNRLPQGLSNSPATLMRMMMSVFGDENFSSVLCYLDDLMVFAPSESVALQRLEMVLSRLSHHNLKLAPKKCCFLRRSVKFLGHIISEEGIKTDPGKVEAVNEIQASDLMEPDGKTPCQKKIRVPHLPIDVLFQNVLLNEDVVDYKDFVSMLRKDLREAAHIARMHTPKEQEQHGKIYNRKVKGCPLTVGVRVLVANRGEKGRRKVADKWESSPYEVMTVYPDISVYRIREINSDKVRVVHRNHL